jgi:hypothetical protein
MNRDTSAIVFILIFSNLTACTSESVKRSTYETLNQAQCTVNRQTPDCNPEHPSYDQYQKDREEALQPNR